MAVAAQIEGSDRRAVAIIGDGAIYSSERVDITSKVMVRLKAGAPEAKAAEPATQSKP